MKQTLLTIAFLSFMHLTKAQFNDAKVYWVGHSLISHTDSYNPDTENLILLMNDFAASQGKTYAYHKHTTPGAPLGWNWGANPDAWADVSDLIDPLINQSNNEYGSFDVMVITEGINLQSTYDWWHPAFYARKFYNAAINANPNTRLFMYESWHHYNASDQDFGSYYGPMESFDWRQYMIDIREVWENIIDEASTDATAGNDPNYIYQGTEINPVDPGLGDETLDIKIIPTGQVLVAVLDRLNENLATDDWSYNGDVLKDIDFFANPLINFPDDLTTTVHPSDPIDDIHPSNVLVYLNGLVHYSVIYQDNPIHLPETNGVPANIANIFKEVAWDVVINDPRTGVTGNIAVENNSNTQEKPAIYPNPTCDVLYLESDKHEDYTITNAMGETLIKASGNMVNVKKLASGIYFITINNKTQKFIKH